jgi:hypothetical protein
VEGVEGGDGDGGGDEIEGGSGEREGVGGLEGGRFGVEGVGEGAEGGWEGSEDVRGEVLVLSDKVIREYTYWGTYVYEVC